MKSLEKKRIILVGLGVSTLHFIIMIFCIFCSLIGGIGPTDNPEQKLGIIVTVAGQAAFVLMMPLAPFMPSWINSNLVFEVLALFANSMLWGFSFSFLLHKYQNRNRTD